MDLGPAIEQPKTPEEAYALIRYSAGLLGAAISMINKRGHAVIFADFAKIVRCVEREFREQNVD